MYAEVKKASDSFLGIPSQCMALESCKIMQGPPSDQYCANLAMKINAKLGGTNSVLVDRPAWQQQPFMVFGAPGRVGTDSRSCCSAQHNACPACVYLQIGVFMYICRAHMQTPSHCPTRPMPCHELRPAINKTVWSGTLCPRNSNALGHAGALTSWLNLCLPGPAGADVTHPKSFNKTEPSIAAVVGSLDIRLGSYATRVCVQGHRLEIIQVLWLCLEPISVICLRQLSPSSIARSCRAVYGCF